MILALNQDTEQVKVWRCCWCGAILLYEDNDVETSAILGTPYLTCPKCKKKTAIYQLHYLKIFDKNKKENIKNE